MDIHKPKPIRNWRELLTEIGTIVLGVSIALAAEQMVEYFHWRHEVALAREALRDEISSIDRFYVRRIAIAPCVARQERETAAILDSLEGKGQPAPFTLFHHGSGATLSDSEWQSERSAQVLTHFPRAELALMSRYYAIIPSIIDWNDMIGAGWSDLSALQNHAANLTPSDIFGLRGQLDRVHRLEFITVLNAQRMLKLSDQLGITRPSLDARMMNVFCKMGDDKSEAVFMRDAAQP
jgi:hypothetical protein